jgi:predicted nucleic acid-binding protein
VFVFDTTVLVYAVGLTHRLRDPCRRLLEAAESGAVRATTTPEAIHRFVRIREHRWGRGDAVRLGLAYADLLSPLVTPGEDHLRQGLRLCDEYDGLLPGDAVLAALALDLEATVVSADSAFAELGEPRHLYPDGFTGTSGALGVSPANGR